MRIVTKLMSRPASDVLRSLPVWLVLMFFAFAVGENVMAQVVVVGRAGGVRVRAPFVSVDVLPFHRGANLRVPFAAIENGFYRSYYARPFPPALGVFPLPVPYPYSYPYTVPALPTFPVIAVPAYPNVYAYEYPELILPDTAMVQQRVYEGAYSSNRSGAQVPLPERLRGAAERLARTLSLREDGDVWLNYLGPQRIIENVDYGRPRSELQDLILNYDGVVSNGTLRSIEFARGFAESRDLLGQYLQGITHPLDSAANRSATETQLPVAPSDVVPQPPKPLPPKPRVPDPQVPVQPSDDTHATAEGRSPVTEIEVGREQGPDVSRPSQKITPTSL